jgi:hypothetical protein
MLTRLLFSLTASATALHAPLPNQRGPGRKPRSKMDEYAPANTKLSHRMPIRSLSDDDLLFLEPLGIRWARIECGADASFEFMKATQDRLRRFSMEIYSAVDHNYRERNVQLGRGRRDEFIEKHCRFLTNCGRLRIPVAANTHTTALVNSPRGYRAREFSETDF